jgi:hypothetical protein
MTITITCMKRRLRGEIVRILYLGDEARQARLDDLTLIAVLEKMQFNVYVDLVRELLHDLKERGFIDFAEERSRATGKSSLRQIRLTPAGRDIFEKTSASPAVEVD